MEIASLKETRGESLGTNEDINYNNDESTVIPTIDLQITQLLIANEGRKENSSIPSTHLITISF